ncbi:MAG: hypothetical protein F6J87_28100 [Spirulina sp. SIO3F2]|nr:hypothetical protein [Spirulina sp. SIO3F2]
MIKPSPSHNLAQLNLVQLYVSLATVPMLGILVLCAGFAPVLVQLGKVSEELFRGDRLPMLPFPWDLVNPD